MLQLINAALDDRNTFGSWNGLREACGALGLDGVEGIWAGEEIPADFPDDLLIGYHLTFFHDWLDFYREDKAALRRKFGSLEAAYAFYGGSDPSVLLGLYRDDLDRAVKLGAEYVVFHVSDASLEEAYTFAWLHSDREVMDAAAELVNQVLEPEKHRFAFLMENQWWAGFTFTEPEKTAYLLDAVKFPDKGILLDTGHLMVTNPNIHIQAEGLRYIHAMLDRHGDLCKQIRAVHLHQSLSGAYIRENTGSLPVLPGDYLERYAVNYAHIQRIDRHKPWTTPEVAELVDRINPDYLTHELSAKNTEARFCAARRQIDALKKGRSRL